jgi:hypothetical protein
MSPDEFFLWGYVKNIVHQVKINDLQHLKARIRDAMAMVTPNMLDRLDICRATKGAKVEFFSESYILRKNFDSILLQWCNQ